MFHSRRFTRISRLHRTRSCAALAVVLVLTNHVVAALPSAGQSSRNQHDVSPERGGERFLEMAGVATLNADLQTDGYRITPLVIGSGQEASGLRVSLLLVEPTQPHPELAQAGDAWEGAVPLAVAAITNAQGLVATVETRLRVGQRGGVEFIHEVRPVAADEVRVRVTDALAQGTSSHSLQVLGRQASGAFAEVVEDELGNARFVNGDLFSRGNFRACVRQCFQQINNPITWAQGLCLGVCLLAGGIAAAATGGAGVAPAVITCLQVCGLAFLIARAAALAGCIINCL